MVHMHHLTLTLTPPSPAILHSPAVIRSSLTSSSLVLIVPSPAVTRPLSTLTSHQYSIYHHQPSLVYIYHSLILRLKSSLVLNLPSLVLIYHYQLSLVLNLPSQSPLYPHQPSLDLFLPSPVISTQPTITSHHQSVVYHSPHPTFQVITSPHLTPPVIASPHSVTTSHR